MSAYHNFVQDFPLRCKSLLGQFGPQARISNREVTLLLAVATSSLIVPFERLSKDAHPSRDIERFAEASDKLALELDSESQNSKLWQSFSGDDWRYKQLNGLIGDPDAWGLAIGTKNIARKKSETILKILRNALAHGNIWTTGDPIDTLIFVSRASQESQGSFHSLQCSPAVLAKFINAWVDYLNEISIPGDVFMENPFYAERAAA